ncbi:hypothetical protein [Cohnella hongkongensis]|uniref:Uncharacterized protein n=1 Tax=Cohnella hongkongensis TaxID=178337 RepID=A0ABV9FCI2_9BACL
MPYALRHSATGTLLARVQRNSYKLEYYGIVQWESAPAAPAVAEALALAGVPPEHEAGRLDAWETILLSEREAKLANVKLRNDPRRTVHYRDGVIGATAASNA